MDFRQVLAALRERWWLPAIAAIVGGAAALAASLLTTPLYTASTQMFVATTQSTNPLDAFQGSQFGQARVTSYAQLVGGEEVATRIVDRLGLDLSPGDVSDLISATAQTETVIIDVTVTDTSPERAQQIAAALDEEFPAFVAELETPEDGGPSPVKVTVTDRPDVPTTPSSPDTARNVALGVLAGLLLGAALAIVRAYMDRTITDAAEASEVAGAPVIGAILRDEQLNRTHTIEGSGSARVAEDYRQLRTNLQFLNVDEPPKVIMVSSALPSEGKTTAVVNLGLALADAGRRVTIVEADLRRPKVTRYLGLVSGVGLTNVLSGTADIEDVAQKHGSGDLHVIAAGPTPPNPGELLSSSQMFSLVDKLRGQNDFVLVDAPPLLPVADSTGLAVYMDGVLLSVRYGSTRKEQLQQSAEMLQRVGARLLGVILNIVPPKVELATAYGYGYSYGYEAGKHSA
jgi:capsular exopolysaccharide synthesis family protein